MFSKYVQKNFNDWDNLNYHPILMLSLDSVEQAMLLLASTRAALEMLLHSVATKREKGGAHSRLYGYPPTWRKKSPILLKTDDFIANDALNFYNSRKKFEY